MPAELRLVSTIRDFMNAQPSAFPLRSNYDPAEYGSGDVLGWDITDDSRLPGDVAIPSDSMRLLAHEAGIRSSLRPALHRLEARGLLARGSEQQHALARRIQVGHGRNRSLPRVYLLKLPAELPDPEPDASPHLDEYVDLHEGLSQAAAELGVPASQVIQQALAQWLSAHGYHRSKSPTVDN